MLTIQIKSAKKHFTLVLLLSALNTFSQTDSVKLEYSKETPSAITKFNETVCEFLMKREQNGKSLWKFNLFQLLSGMANIAYEKKLSHNFSVNTNIGTQLNNTNSLLGVHLSSTFIPLYYKQSLDLDLRYYYNLKRRLRLGKSVGFSGNYFGIASNNNFLMTSSTYNLYDKGVYIPVKSENKYLQNNLSLIYGMQRRLGKLWYIDCTAKFGYGTVYKNQSDKDGNGLSRYLHNSFRWQFCYNVYIGVGIAF